MRRDLLAVPAPWAPTVVANLTLGVLLDHRVERAPDRLIASGFLRGEATAVVERIERLGRSERRRLEDGGWPAVVLAA